MAWKDIYLYRWTSNDDNERNIPGLIPLKAVELATHTFDAFAI